ncbi:MAG TPA: IPT/TIG domain-containing protein [Thermoanaerobaculia bacterium]|nr:IPT/TIG domain-containing protein [Thermoanaerobaculia bacterium]
MSSRSSSPLRPWLVVWALLVSTASLSAQPPATHRAFYDDLGQLVKVVDSAGNVVEYVYDPVGNLLEVRRTGVAALALFHFSPGQGPVGTEVTLQGQGFSALAGDNAVAFAGTPASVSSASATELLVTVPTGAATGPISVTVGGETAVSSSDFTVTAVPAITGLDPALLLSGDVVADLAVTGVNLGGAGFAFHPLLAPPAITVDGATVAPDGASASLALNVGASTTGLFVLVASSSGGSSTALPSAANTLRVLSPGGDDDFDGLTNADERSRGTDPLDGDSDDDGFGDGDEVASGSDPLAPASRPVDPFASPGEVFPVTLALLDGQNPGAPGLPNEAGSPAFSLLDSTSPAAPGLPNEAASLTFSLLDTTSPAASGLPSEAISPTFSLLDAPSPAAPGLPNEAVGTAWSVEDQSPP